MKIAYLITAYNNPKHINKLIKSIHTDNHDIFVHIDKKSKIKFDLPNYDNLFIIENPIKVYWGSFTFIKALLLLLKKSFDTDKYDYYILLSGACYPVRSNTYIEKFIKINKNKEFINIVKMPDNGKTFDRIDYYFMSEYEKSYNILHLSRRIINQIIRKFKIKYFT